MFQGVSSGSRDVSFSKAFEGRLKNISGVSGFQGVSEGLKGVSDVLCTLRGIA